MKPYLDVLLPELRAATQVRGLINSGIEDMSDPGGYRAWSIEVLC